MSAYYTAIVECSDATFLKQEVFRQQDRRIDLETAVMRIVSTHDGGNADALKAAIEHARKLLARD